MVIWFSSGNFRSKGDGLWPHIGLFRPRDWDNVLRKSPSNENLISVSAVCHSALYFLTFNQSKSTNLKELNQANRTEMNYVTDLTWPKPNRTESNEIFGCISTMIPRRFAPRLSFLELNNPLFGMWLQEGPRGEKMSKILFPREIASGYMNLDRKSVNIISREELRVGLLGIALTWRTRRPSMSGQATPSSTAMKLW